MNHCRCRSAAVNLQRLHLTTINPHGALSDVRSTPFPFSIAGNIIISPLTIAISSKCFNFEYLTVCSRKGWRSVAPMARRPPSPRSQPTDEEKTLRRTSTRTSNPNVFSDEYALNPFESLGDLSPTSSIDSRAEHLTTERGEIEYTPPGLPGIGLSFSSSTAGRSDHLAGTSRTLSLSSHSTLDSQITPSTSSRFSMPRAQSPYRGPTAPSQPYGLYPQVTRASSIASESTIRPVERPFVPQGGPEHPYSMYPQNTVPEEDDDPEPHITLGFPGLAQVYQSGNTSPENDLGDIVGSDGHVEQLPPYSRYADNVIAKGDMATIEPHATNISDANTLRPSVQPVESGSDVELTAVNSEPSTAEVARKEGLTGDKKRKTYCGLPLWTLVTLVVVVVLAAVLGGVIGGIVGNKKGADRAAASSATTTVWLDADPAETGPSTPPCPTGHFQIPLNQTQEINSCVVDSAYSSVWSCFDFARLGLNVFESAQGRPPLSVVFDDYSVRPQLFKYGPQPPDFNGTAFTLSPFKDKDDDQLGVALFFSVLFDKLNILPGDALTPPTNGKRSVAAEELVERGASKTPDYLNVGDQPWYCFWNSTISEFWVFLGQDMNNSSMATVATTSPAFVGGPTTATPVYVTSPSSTPSSTTSMSPSTSHDPAFTMPYPSQPTGAAHWTSSPAAKVRRDASNTGSYDYPKLVKMVEKRKPQGNVPPYCQKMQVLNNWQIVPIPNVPTIAIQESEYSAAATATGGSRMAMRRRADDTVQQLGSNCVCEWFSV
ncbi:hypothetical protein ABEF95_009228 [Exophiala dermatitidis]